MSLSKVSQLPRVYLYGLIGGLAAGFLIWLWSFSPLAEKLDLHLFLTMAGILKSSQFTHLFLGLAYVLASIVVFPFSVLDTFTITVFGPVLGGVYAYLFSSFCAVWMFVLVRYFRKKPARIPEKVIPAHWAQAMNQPGIIQVAVARNLPIAFSINNVLFALSPVKTGDYIIGTLIGNICPILFLAVIFSQTKKAFLHPSLWQFACLFFLVLGAVSLYWLIRKRLGFNRGNQPEKSGERME